MGKVKARCRGCGTVVTFFGDECADCLLAELDTGFVSIIAADTARLSEMAEAC